MKTKTLITVLLFVVIAAAASSLKAQNTIAFYTQSSGGNSENMISGNLTPMSYPYFSSTAMVEFALEVTGNIYPIPNIFLSTSGGRLTYTSSTYGNTVYATIPVMGQTYNMYNFTIDKNSITGTGSVTAKVRIVRIVSGNPYATIAYPSQITITASK